MLREEETGFNTKGNWNYQRALNTCSFILRDFPIAQIKNLPATQKTRVWSLGWEDPLEKEMATHSSILAWRIPWTGEPGRLQSIGSQRVGHDWETGTGIHSRGLTDKQNSECDEHYQESNTKKERKQYREPRNGCLGKTAASGWSSPWYRHLRNPAASENLLEGNQPGLYWLIQREKSILKKISFQSPIL